MSQRRFTRQQPGSPISAKMLNAMQMGIEQAGAFTAEAPLDSMDFAGGRIFRSSARAVLSYGKATSSIAPMSGTTPGTGTADLYYDNGTSLATTKIGATVSNITDKTITSGAVLVLGKIGPRWTVIVVDSCTNMT